MALKIDQQDREPVTQQQRRPRKHGGAVGAYGVQKKHDRRVAALIEPPAGDGISWPWHRHDLSRETSRQRNRIINRPHEPGTKQP
jgi:hypothetical protein